MIQASKLAKAPSGARGTSDTVASLQLKYIGPSQRGTATHALLECCKTLIEHTGKRTCTEVQESTTRLMKTTHSIEDERVDSIRTSRVIVLTEVKGKLDTGTDRKIAGGCFSTAPGMSRDLEVDTTRTSLPYVDELIVRVRRRNAETISISGEHGEERIGVGVAFDSKGGHRVAALVARFRG